MTASESKELAALIQEVKDMRAQYQDIKTQLRQNTRDTASIKSTLDNLTGGKQALMWATGIAMTILITIASWLGLHK